MCILSPYDTFHWGNHDKTREEVLFKKVYLYLALAIEPWKYSSWCYFRSGIVHCASVATVVPSIPHYQVGGCTQWFNHFLLKSIGWEYSNSLDCLVLRLGHVSSQMTGYDDPNELGTCTPQQAAEGVLRDLGHEDSTFGHQRHDVLWSWINMVMTYVAPERLQQLFMSNKLQRHKRIIKEKMAREGGTVYNAVYYQ